VQPPAPSSPQQFATPSAPSQPPSGISFEETPRPAAPPASPFTPGPQPPIAR
jgi:hypothetical protein